MAPKGMEMCLIVLVFVTVSWGGSHAQSSCTNAIISMSPCLNYITGNSTTPSSSCCTQLGTVVRSQPQCLCQVLNGGGGSTVAGLNINQTLALALPSACNVQTPPVSSCNAASPTDSPSSSGNGSKTDPTTNGNSSDGNSTKLSVSLLFFLFFVASQTSSFGKF